MPVEVKIKDTGMKLLAKQMHFLATHEVRVGVLTGAGVGGNVDGADLKKDTPPPAMKKKGKK